MATLPGAITYLDTSGDLADHAGAAGQGFSLQTGTDQTLVGDAHALLGHAAGGEDNLVSSTTASGTLLGDALALGDHALGGNDTLRGFALANGYVEGDGVTLDGHARGGDDVLTVYGGYGPAVGLGDGELLTGHTRGGDDTLLGTGSRTTVVLAGDGLQMNEHARGGDDVLSTNSGGYLFGDAQVLSGDARGGDDRLTAFAAAPGPNSAMYGDGAELRDHAFGGDDTLVGASYANDFMWGDAATVGPGAQTGADLFVFAPRNGSDQIMDFEPGKDRIELDGFGFSGFADLASRFEATSQGLLIQLDPSDSILVRGVTSLSPGDFVLA